THPLLTALEEQRKSLDYRGKSEARAALPSLKLIGGYAYRGVGIGNDGTVSDNWNDGFSNSVSNGLVGVGITWNISDLYTQKQRAGSFKKQAESEGHRHKQYKQQMQAELAAIQNKLSRQYVEVEKTNEAQQQAKDAYQMYLSRYKSGLMDLSNLLQIQILLEQAENKHIEAAFGFWMLMASEAELMADFSHVFNNL
ncbi:TolC family protein, partial [Gelidibacter sp.]|uniref:TolC family protein n=1 Tax=Gelidibacter sp. TaxID=2018083 RepID=UPI002CBD79BE